MKDRQRKERIKQSPQTQKRKEKSLFSKSHAQT